MESVLLSKKEFKEIMEVLPKIAKETHKRELKGVYFDSNNVVAIDGYRMSLRKLKVILKGSYLVSGASLKSAYKLLYREVKWVELNFRDEDLLIEYFDDARGVVLNSFKLGYFREQYVDYKSLIPSNFNGYIIADAKRLCDVVKRTKSFIALEVKDSVTMGVYLAEEKIKDIGDREHKLTFLDTILLDKKFGDNYLAGFNPMYLKQALCDMKGKVMIKYIDRFSCILLVGEGERQFEVVLPIRLRTK